MKVLLMFQHNDLFILYLVLHLHSQNVIARNKSNQVQLPETVKYGIEQSTVAVDDFRIVEGFIGFSKPGAKHPV